MNERFENLAEEAMVHVPGAKGLHTRAFSLEKFAELIVRECIQVGGPEDSYTDEWFKAKADSVNKIKQHFGVDDDSAH